jgi:hypothetical protein
MPRLDTTPITQQDIKDYLASTGDDFRLELEVYNICKTFNFEASHGGTYQDPVTKKTRQYDIRASRVREQDRFKVQLAIECKCLKPYFPLLVYQTPKAENENYHEIVFSYEPPDPSLHTIPTAQNERFAGKYSVYRDVKFVGKSTVQIGKTEQKKEFTGDDSEVFDKWSQALSSADDLISQSAHFREEYKTKWFFAATVPILVVPDNTLWTADFSEDGVQVGAPKQADEAIIYIGKDYWHPGSISYTISYLHIYTLKAFKKFIRSFPNEDNPNSEIWDEFFPYDKIQKLKSARRT